MPGCSTIVPFAELHDLKVTELLHFMGGPLAWFGCSPILPSCALQDVGALSAGIPSMSAVDSLSARVTAEGDQEEMMKSLPLDPPLAALKNQIEKQVNDINQKVLQNLGPVLRNMTPLPSAKLPCPSHPDGRWCIQASELSAVLQSLEDEATGRLLAGGKGHAHGTLPGGKTSNSAIYNSINNMSQHAKKQERALQKLLHQVTLLPRGSTPWKADALKHVMMRPCRRQSSLPLASRLAIWMPVWIS